MFSGDGEEREEEPVDVVSGMLVDGGYYRARIATLPPFDMLVGGLAWAITLINMEVDLSLDDQATLGQKIKLAEIICKVLQRMKCPTQLLPHQIQGLDFPHVLPVMHWLLEKVVEVRADTEAAVRRQSERQFDAAYVLPADAAREEHRHNVDGYVVTVREQYKPRRKMRRATTTAENNESGRVRGVMMEYGANINELAVKRLEEEKEGAGGKKKASAAQEEEWKAVEEQDKLQLEGLQKLLSETKTGAQMAVSSKKMAAVVAMQGQQIREAQAKNAAEQAELEALRAAHVGSKDAHRRQVGALEKKIAQAETASEVAAAAKEAGQTAVGGKAVELKKKEAYNAKAQRETTKLEAEEAKADQAVLAALRRLVTLNEALKAQEKEFKASCKKQLATLTGLTAAMGEGTLSPEEEAKIAKIDQLHAAEAEKWAKLRAAVAAKAREIMMVQRRIDEIPTRQELLQFERRFTELYDQVQNKQEETRRHYQTYNTLNDTIEYATKEIEILESMFKQIDEQGVLSKDAYADAFKTSMERTLAGVVKMLERKEQQFAESGAKKQEVDLRLAEQVEKQRKHFKAVKDLQVEFDRNAKIRKAQAK